MPIKKNKKGQNRHSEIRLSGKKKGKNRPSWGFNRHSRGDRWAGWELSRIERYYFVTPDKGIYENI